MNSTTRKMAASILLLAAAAALAGCGKSYTYVEPVRAATPVPAVNQPSADSSPAGLHTLDLYDYRDVTFQRPGNDCTANSTEIMLNLVATTSPAKGAGFSWDATLSVSTQGRILQYQRDHMTMLAKSAGSDAHGWRNSLNYFGWGSINAGVYADRAYGSYAEAARAAVVALATTGKPVGVLARGGGFCQVMSGYTVRGADPATGSTDFSIVSVYLTDTAGAQNKPVSYHDWQRAGGYVGFTAWAQGDSPYRDSIDGEVGNAEWTGKWVTVAPVV